MKTPSRPLDLMVKATRERLTRSEQLELTSYIGRLYDVAQFNEGLVYSLTAQRDKLRAENEFMTKLFNVKAEE